MARGTALAEGLEGSDELLETFTGEERVLGILPFVADLGSTPRWHHLLFTQDKILAIPASSEPREGAARLFLPRSEDLADRYPSVRAALALVAVPQPLTPAHATAIIPYAVVRRVRLRRGHDSRTLPELEIRAGRGTTWWFLQKEDETADSEKACFARDLLLSLLPFPVELVGFSESPRPPEWHLRRGMREPLPLLSSTGATVREAPTSGPEAPGEG